MTSPASAFRISRTSQALGMRPPVPLPPVHGAPVRPGGASRPRVLLALRDPGTRVRQAIPCSVTEERLENDVGSPFIPFNTLAGHRPLSRAYHEQKWHSWLSMASDYRCATDECAFPPLEIEVQTIQS